MTRPFHTLIAGTLALWALLFFPARNFGGQQAVIHSVVAAVLCLVPTSLTLAWASRKGARSADQQMFLLLGGTAVRMTFVLGIGLGLYWAVSYFQQLSFWVWLLIFYLFTLGLEIVLLQRGQTARE